MPTLRPEKAVSGGARIVSPWFEVLSCEFKLSATLVLCSSLMNTVKWPSFSRMAVTLGGPGGAGAAAGDWEVVGTQLMRKRRTGTWAISVFISFSRVKTASREALLIAVRGSRVDEMVVW